MSYTHEFISNNVKFIILIYKNDILLKQSYYRNENVKFEFGDKMLLIIIKIMPK